MPLSKKGAKIKKAMEKTYKGKGGKKKAGQVFYASKNARKITGIERKGKKK